MLQGNTLAASRRGVKAKRETKVDFLFPGLIFVVKNGSNAEYFYMLCRLAIDIQDVVYYRLTQDFRI
jgi:hypothetical protein